MPIWGGSISRIPSINQGSGFRVQACLPGCSLGFTDVRASEILVSTRRMKPEASDERTMCSQPYYMKYIYIRIGVS